MVNVLFENIWTKKILTEEKGRSVLYFFFVKINFNNDRDKESGYIFIK